MASQCAWCGGLDTQHGLAQLTCLTCGLHTDYQGRKDLADCQELGSGFDVTEGTRVEDADPLVFSTHPHPELIFGGGTDG